MKSFAIAFSLAALRLASAAPTDQPSFSYYYITGANAQNSNTTAVSEINGQTLIPYYGSFWFGLSKDAVCRAPGPNKDNVNICNADNFKPTYSVDNSGNLNLATYYVTERITKTAAGQITYEGFSAMPGWSVGSNNLLAYNGETQFYACPEQRGNVSTAWQVWHNSYEQSEQNACLKLNLQATVATGVNTDNLPYGYETT